MNRLYRLQLLLGAFIIVILSGCATTIPPVQSGEEVLRWSQEIEDHALKLNMEWAMPMQPGPHPTVIVHPGRGQDSRDLREVIDELALNGYLAVAVDYQRMIRGEYKSTMFPWRNREDSRRVLHLILENPLIDDKRVATLGFSLGGAHSLLLAANNPQIKAVISYYPMTNFPDWISERERNPFWRMVFNFMQWSYNAESSLNTGENHLKLLSDYSAINHTDSIQAPVLIIHGNEDGVSPLRHSQQLMQGLERSGNVHNDLVVVVDAGHAFNSSPSEQTTRSWKRALQWLDRHLSDSTRLAMAGDK